jgi:hypothetical protein
MLGIVLYNLIQLVFFWAEVIQLESKFGHASIRLMRMRQRISSLLRNANPSRSIRRRSRSVAGGSLCPSSLI